MSLLSYRSFLENKKTIDPDTGLKEIPALNGKLFDFQKDITAWALRRGRAAGKGMKYGDLPWWFWCDEYGDVLRDIWADPARPTICDKGLFKKDPCEWWGWMAEALWAEREGLS